MGSQPNFGNASILGAYMHIWTPNLSLREALKKSIFFRGWVHKFGSIDPNKTNFYGFPYSLTMFHSHKSDNKDSNRWPYLSGICCHELQISCWLQKLSMAALPKKDHFPLSSSFAFKHLIISANCWQIWYRYFYVPFNLGNSNEPLKLIWLPLNWTKGAKQSDFYCCD